MIGPTVVVGTYGQVFAPVPRIIHQTWKSDEIPDEWKPYQHSWRHAHPGWEYKLWTDEANRRLVADRYPWFLPTYDAFPRDIQRVDAAKYLIVYTYGGVYADLDCECLKPLDPLTSRGGAVVSLTRDRVVDCAVFASPAGHALWGVVLRRMQWPALFARLLWHVPGCRASHVLFTTGTQMFKHAVGAYLASASAPAADGITVCDAALLSSRSWLDRYQRFDEPEAFVCHHYADSWLRPAEQRVHVWLTRRTGWVLLGLVLLVVLGTAVRC